MKIALLGSAPSSLNLAPFGNPEWQIWGCSPGVYYVTPRVDAWFELHRPEFGQIGKPNTQKQWFSPEYVAWMGQQKLVWMYEPVPEIPGSKALPYAAMTKRWGSYFWNSSLSYMIAMAMDHIIEERAARKASGISEADQAKLALEDAVGLWGVDMAATEEWVGQRSGCQHFLCEANRLGIKVVVPPESDLLRPDPPYGLFESTHFMIKSTVRLNELRTREQQTQAQIDMLTTSLHFVKGAIDNHLYHMKTWGDDRQGIAAHPEVALLQASQIASADEHVPHQSTTSSVAGLPAQDGQTVVAIRQPEATKTG